MRLRSRVVVAFAPAFAAALTLGGCQPLRTPHTFDLEFPAKRADFTARFLGTPSGRTAMWITTADDVEANGRYEGLQIVVDPGTPSDVESVVIPWLAAHGLKKSGAISYLLSTSAESPMLAGVERLRREFSVAHVVVPDPPGSHVRTRDFGGRLPGYLEFGPEISARVLRPEGTEALGAQAFSVRFIDMQLLLLPALRGPAADDYGRALQKILAKEGLHATLVWDEGEASRGLDSEIVVGRGEPAGDSIVLASPRPGEALEVTTNGSEMHAPGARTRSRFGHWIDCRGDAARCDATLDAAATGPLVVPLTIAGAQGWFLVDTRAPLSFLATPRFRSIPGWEKAETGAHGHGAEAIGLEVPPFTLGSEGPLVRRWHVLPCEPFTVAGREIAGVLGMDLLQSFRLTIAKTASSRSLTFQPNFDEPREKLGAAATAADGSGWDVPMDHSPAGPLLLATLDGESRSLIVDLGAAQSAVFVRPAIFSEKVRAPADRVWNSFDVEGDLSKAAWTTTELRAGSLDVADLSLFGAHFPGRTLLAVDHPLASDRLGMDFFGGFSSVELDFRRRSLRLTK